MQRVGGLRAVLLGPNQQENLALQYLAASARQAGHQEKTSPLDAQAFLRGGIHERIRSERFCWRKTTAEAVTFMVKEIKKRMMPMKNRTW